MTRAAGSIAGTTRRGVARTAARRGVARTALRRVAGATRRGVAGTAWRVVTRAAGSIARTARWRIARTARRGVAGSARRGIAGTAGKVAWATRWGVTGADARGRARTTWRRVAGAAWRPSLTSRPGRQSFLPVPRSLTCLTSRTSLARRLGATWPLWFARRHGSPARGGRAGRKRLPRISRTGRKRLARVGRTGRKRLPRISRTGRKRLARVGRTRRERLARVGRTRRERLARVGRTRWERLTGLGRARWSSVTGWAGIAGARLLTGRHGWLRRPAALGGRHPAGSGRVHPWLVRGPRRRSRSSLRALGSKGSRRVQARGPLRPGTFGCSRELRPVGVAGDVEQAVRRVDGRRVQHLVSFPARACTGISLGTPGRTRRRAGSDPLVVGLTRIPSPVLVARLAPGLRRVRRVPGPTGPAAPEKGTDQEDDQADRDEDQAHGQAQGGDPPAGMLLAQAPREARTHAERTEHDQHCARDRPGQDEPRPQGGRI